MKNYTICIRYQMSIDAEDLQKAVETATQQQLPLYRTDSFAVEEAFETIVKK